MPTIYLEWRENGVLTNPFSANIGDERDPPVGTFGVRRTDTLEELVEAGTALDNDETGILTLEVAEPAEGLVYEYWVSIVGESGDPPTVIHDYIAGEGTEPPTIKILRFVAVKDGAPVVLDDPPTLSSPSATFGVKRIDNGVSVVPDATAYTHVGGGGYTYGFAEPGGDLDYRYYVEAEVDGVTYRLPRTTHLIDSAALAIGRYTDSHRIEQQFGIDNVHKWVALDDYDEAADYALRLYQHIADAEAEIDDALRDSAVSVPIESDVPSLITQIATALAGVRFYEARGVVDFNTDTGLPQHRLQYQKREAWKRIALLKTGQLRLSGETVVRHPIVVDDE